MNGFVVHQEITDWKNKKIDYSRLWQPITIKNMTLRNRIVMSPMGTYTPMQDGTESEEDIAAFCDALADCRKVLEKYARI